MSDRALRLSEGFEPALDQIAAVRRFVTAAGTDWGLEADQVVLVASELAANAVVHAQSPFTVSLASQGLRLRVEVADLNPDPPVAQAVPADAPAGRGLMIINQLATSWGVQIDGPGKTVWVELPVAYHG